MFSIGQPSSERIARYLSGKTGLPLTYPELGMTAWQTAPAGYVIDRNRVKLGQGRSTFDRAVAALQGWEHFNVGWARVADPRLPLEKESTNAVISWLPPVAVTCACRIVYTINSTEASVETFGFAYGTLPDHPECGEERFTIQWNKDDDSVWYELYALSKPGLLLVRATYPLARLMQKRFAKDSMAAMVGAVKT